MAAATGEKLQAIILAGGKGERLRPHTDDRPKPMVLILEQPILEYQVRWLAGQGVSTIVFSCGYLHHVIQDHFEDGAKFGVEIRYAIEEEPLGRGGGIKLAWHYLDPGSGPVIATNGDVMTSFALAPMIHQHQETGAVATILVTPYVSQYGIVDITEDGKVTGFRSEPRLPYWINAGVYVLDRSMYDLLPEKGDHEENAFPLLAREGKLLTYKHEGFWRAVDTVKDLTTVKNHLAKRLLDSWLLV
jgi:NDP-sugar pyrophosphorylase family protein